MAGLELDYDGLKPVRDDSYAQVSIEKNRENVMAYLELE